MKPQVTGHVCDTVTLTLSTLRSGGLWSYPQASAYFRTDVLLRTAHPLHAASALGVPHLAVGAVPAVVRYQRSRRLTPIVARGTKALAIDKAGFHEVREFRGGSSLKEPPEQIRSHTTISGEFSESIGLLLPAIVCHFLPPQIGVVCATARKLLRALLAVALPPA